MKKINRHNDEIYWSRFGKQMINSVKKTAVVAVDRQGRIVFWNKASNEVLGKKDEDVMGQKFDEAFKHLNISDRFIRWSLVTGEEFDFYKGPSVTKNGRTLLIETCPIKDDIENNVIGAVCVFRDITEEASVERIQLESKFVLDSIPQGVLAVDKEHRITTINKAAQRILGLEGLPIIGKTYEEIATVLGIPHKYWYILRTLAKGTHYQKQEYSINVMGRTVVLSLDCSRLESQYGEVVGAVAVFEDITREREMEEVMRRSEKLAALGQLAAGMAHEIRNPLTTVKGFLQLMQGKTNDQTYDEYIKIIAAELKQVNHIITEFLLFSQPQAPKFKETSPFEILEEAFALISSQAAMQEIRLAEKIPATLPLIKVDREQVKQVLINLARNALEAMPNGGTLTINACYEEGNIIFQVTDTGRGIPTEELERIFDPFFTTREDLGGTGLGLTVAHRIVETHGGHIQVESIVGKGSKFSVILPVSNEG
ncbi:MAG: PAS domain S-box protein [Clostridia bacterium]|nr:PAS domain S-box protein [Clostridia bacterium]